MQKVLVMIRKDDPRAECAEQLGKFTADRPTADDENRLGELGQVDCCFKRKKTRIPQSGRLRNTRRRPGCDQESIRGIAPSIRLDRNGRDEACLVLDKSDSGLPVSTFGVTNPRPRHDLVLAFFYSTVVDGREPGV